MSLDMHPSHETIGFRENMSSDNVLMEFFVQEANACKDWIRKSDRDQFEAFYKKVLNGLRDIGLETMNPSTFYDIPLQARLEELDRLEKEHRLELEAAFMAVWLSSEMKNERSAYHHKMTLKMMENH
jgi:hypothetical protein